MKISTSEMTTAEVVDSPTPLAPPPVVEAPGTAHLHTRNLLKHDT